MSILNADTASISLKEQAKAMIDGLPDDCTIEDVQYHLFVLGRIRQGIESIERGEGIPHEEVKKRMEKWLSK